MANGEINNDQLKLFFDRIERLEEEKAGIGDDIKDVYAEAKAAGFNTKVMRKVHALKKMDTAAREEERSLIDAYMDAIGLSFDETPLAQAANDFKRHCAESGADKVSIRVGEGEEIVVFERPNVENLEQPKYSYFDGDCPGHQASDDDPKRCRHCGTHVDEERPDEPEAPTDDDTMTIKGGDGAPVKVKKPKAKSGTEALAAAKERFSEPEAKPKRTRASKTVRDPADGSLVTVN